MIATATHHAIDPGWHEGMTMEAYLAIPAMSAGGMEDFRRSPAHFKWGRDNPKEQTPAMREGTALHMALLEPHLFEGRYIALGQCEATKKGDGLRCTNQGSVYRTGFSFCGTHDPFKGQPMDEGIEVMANEALSRIEGMKRSVLAHPEASQFFRGKGSSEVTGIALDPTTGVLLKIRLDRQVTRAEFIHVDVKTCVDASEDAFSRQVGRLGYHRRSAFYRRVMGLLGRQATASVLIAVESQPPHGCAAYLFDEDDLSLAGQDIDRQLRRYAECVQRNEWPGYETGLRHLRVKPWDLPEAIYEEETEAAA